MGGEWKREDVKKTETPKPEPTPAEDEQTTDENTEQGEE